MCCGLRRRCVKTGSSALDDALYTMAHPTAPDATPGGATHEDVVAAIRNVASAWPEFKVFATELADTYEKEHCQPV